MKRAYRSPTAPLMFLTMLLLVTLPAVAQLTTFHTVPGEVCEPDRRRHVHGESRVGGDELDSVPGVPIPKIAEPFAMRVDGALGADDAAGMARGVAITGVAPQPASGRVRIGFRTVAGALYLDLYDARGALVERAIDGVHHDAGEHEITLATETLPSGLYIVRLRQGSTILTRALIVTK